MSSSCSPSFSSFVLVEPPRPCGSQANQRRPSRPSSSSGWRKQRCPLFAHALSHTHTCLSTSPQAASEVRLWKGCGKAVVYRFHQHIALSSLLLPSLHSTLTFYMWVDLWTCGHAIHLYTHASPRRWHRWLEFGRRTKSALHYYPSNWCVSVCVCIMYTPWPLLTSVRKHIPQVCMYVFADTSA